MIGDFSPSMAHLGEPATVAARTNAAATPSAKTVA
jgi:hypothetical protein